MSYGFARQLQCLHRRLHDGQPASWHPLYRRDKQLPSRIAQHRAKRIEGFTKEYGLDRLVWYEPHERMTSAIQREKSLKRYPREWKINLIERDNPEWDDLYPNLVGMKRQKLPE